MSCTIISDILVQMDYQGGECWIERGESNWRRKRKLSGNEKGRKVKRGDGVDSQSHPKITEQNPNCPSDLTQDKNFDFDMIFPLRTPSTSIPTYQLLLRHRSRKLTRYFDFSIIFEELDELIVVFRSVWSGWVGHDGRCRCRCSREGREDRRCKEVRGKRAS